MYCLPRSVVSLLLALAVLLLVQPASVQAQTPVQPQQILGLEESLRLVLANHPIMRQASLLPDAARMEVRTARGAFDPVVDLNWDRKTYEGKEYYTHWNNTLKVPTWIGLDLKAGYEQNSGDRLSNELYTPKGGLLYLQLEMNITRGLVTDARRTALRQAQAMVQLNEAEQQKLVNKLLETAGKDYMAWYEAWRKAQLYRTNRELAQTRLAALKIEVATGQSAPVDTLEAAADLAARTMAMREMEMMEQNAALIFSSHLWSENQEPLELLPGVQPATLDHVFAPLGAVALDTLMGIAASRHPELIKLEQKQRMLELDKRLAIWQLMPQVSLAWKPMFNPGSTGTLAPDFVARNYFAGVQVYMPLFLRKERGKLAQIKLKLLDNNYDQTFQRRYIVNNVEAAWNQATTLESLLALQRTTVDLASRLRQAEQTKFENGESYLFLIIKREQDQLKAEEKLAELTAKYAKARLALFLNAGLPSESAVESVE